MILISNGGKIGMWNVKVCSILYLEWRDVLISYTLYLY